MKTIFVIDDEPGVLEEMEAWLGEIGYRVVTAASGIQGLDRLKGLLPHLIILDIIMPQMDGFEVLSKIKRDNRTADIPVIMLTAKSESAAILKAQAMKAADYVIKPFKADDFLDLIQKYEI